MKRCQIFFILFLSFTVNAVSQKTETYEKGYTALKNLESISSMAPYTTGGMGFDNRYEGVRGTPRLFDTLYSSILRIKGQDLTVKLETDVDVVSNRLIFLHPRTKELMSIPAEMVEELIVNVNGREMVFRSTADMKIDKPLENVRICQVLYENRIVLIKLPDKKFIEADYKNGYSPQRTYDEYEPFNRYYISVGDSIFHQLLPNKKSLLRYFPERRDIINSEENRRSQFKSDEEYLVSLILLMK